VWASWSAAEHGRVYRQWRLVSAVTESLTVAPSLLRRAGQRLFQWLEESAADVLVGVHLLVDHSRKISCLAAAQMPPGFGSESCPVRPGVGSAEQLAALNDRMREGSSLLARLRTQEAVGALLAAQRIDLCAVQSSVLDVFRGGQPLFRVVADSFRGQASIKQCGAEGGQVAAFALLLPLESAGQALTAAFQRLEGEEIWIAEFNNVQDGAYWLVIGPMTEA
jgi:hypothetical protein